MLINKFVTKITSKIKKLFAKSPYILLIKKIDFNAKGEPEVVLQVTGKPVFFSHTAKELLKNEDLLFLLPPAQLKTVVILGCTAQSMQSAPYKIYLVNHETESVVVREEATGGFFTLSIKEITNDLLLIDNFSKSDIFRLGVFHSDHMHKLENEELRRLKRASLKIVK